MVRIELDKNDVLSAQSRCNWKSRVSKERLLRAMLAEEAVAKHLKRSVVHAQKPEPMDVEGGVEVKMADWQDIIPPHGYKKLMSMDDPKKMLWKIQGGVKEYVFVAVDRDLEFAYILGRMSVQEIEKKMKQHEQGWWYVELREINCIFNK